jgi:hypothetical protein
MDELIKWLKENLGEGVQIITPQFEREEPLEYGYRPKNEEEFKVIIEKAPWKILEGLGFRKWDSMNNIIKENMSRNDKSVSIQIINARPGEEKEMVFDLTHKGCPTELLDPDEEVILIPGEWYRLIPDGFMVTDIFGITEPFIKGETDDDIRFGCLSYGIRRVK